jgi:hypothetical protein
MSCGILGETFVLSGVYSVGEFPLKSAESRFFAKLSIDNRRFIFAALLTSSSKPVFFGPLALIGMGGSSSLLMLYEEAIFRPANPVPAPRAERGIGGPCSICSSCPRLLVIARKNLFNELLKPGLRLRGSLIVSVKVLVFVMSNIKLSEIDKS